MADIFNCPNWEDASDYSESPNQPSDKDLNIINEGSYDLGYNKSPFPSTKDNFFRICDKIDELDYNRNPLSPSYKEIKIIYAYIDELVNNSSPLSPTNYDLKIISRDMQRVSFNQPTCNTPADIFAATDGDDDSAPNAHYKFGTQIDEEYGCSGDTTIAGMLDIRSAAEKEHLCDDKSDYSLNPIAPSSNDLSAIYKELDIVERDSNAMLCRSRFKDSPKTDFPVTINIKDASSVTGEIPSYLNKLLDMGSKSVTLKNQVTSLSPRQSALSLPEPDRAVSIHLPTLAKELYSPLTPEGTISEPIATCSPPVVYPIRRVSVTSQSTMPKSKHYINNANIIENKENSPLLNISPAKLLLTLSRSRERSQSRDKTVKNAFSTTMVLYDDELTPTKSAALTNSSTTLFTANDKEEQSLRRKMVQGKLFSSGHQQRSYSSGRLQSSCNELIARGGHTHGNRVRSVSVCRQRPSGSAVPSSARFNQQLQQNSVSKDHSTPGSRSISPVYRTDIRASDRRQSKSAGRSASHKRLTTEERELRRIEEARQLEKVRIAENRMLHEKIKAMHSMTGSPKAATVSSLTSSANENIYRKAAKTATSSVATKKAPTVTQPFQFRTELRAAQNDFKGKSFQVSNIGGGGSEDVLRGSETPAKIGGTTPRN